MADLEADTLDALLLVEQNGGTMNAKNNWLAGHLIKLGLIDSIWDGLIKINESGTAALVESRRPEKPPDPPSDGFVNCYSDQSHKYPF